MSAAAATDAVGSVACLISGCAGNGVVVEALSRVDKHAGTLLNLIRHVVMLAYQLLAAAAGAAPAEGGGRAAGKGVWRTFREPVQPLWLHFVMSMPSLLANQLTLMCYSFDVSHCLQVRSSPAHRAAAARGSGGTGARLADGC